MIRCTLGMHHAPAQASIRDAGWNVVVQCASMAHKCKLHWLRHLQLTALLQILEQYMTPSLYSAVDGGPYGERQLMQVRPRAIRSGYQAR